MIRTLVGAVFRPQVAAQTLHRAEKSASSPRGDVQRRAGTVAVLGAGHGGMSLAAYLGQLGHEVFLWNRSPGPIEQVIACGGIRLQMPDREASVARVAIATTEIADVLAAADLVLVAAPACRTARPLRGPVRRSSATGKRSYCCPGGRAGPWSFAECYGNSAAGLALCWARLTLSPFAARTTGPANAVIFGAKAEVSVAALPAVDTSALITECRRFLPMVRSARSVLRHRTFQRRRDLAPGHHVAERVPDYSGRRV